MTEEHFREFVNVDIPCALFHVGDTDIDDISGGKVDETRLVELIAQNIQCLQYKPLQWFLDKFLIKDYEG